MAEVIHHVEQDFWRPPVTASPVTEKQDASSDPAPGPACQECATEFLLGARFCHACGTPRVRARVVSQSAYRATVDRVAGGAAQLLSMASTISLPKLVIPGWFQYLHFHQIKRWIALPTASLIAFLIGMGCIAGAIGVSFVYKAQNFVDFQAVQMWRIEWLLAATASFVAGILLKTPSGQNKD